MSALAALQAEREARLQAEAVAASARAELSDNEALIAHLELRIEKLKRELYGQRSERTVRLLHPIGYNYYATLRKKLHWHEYPTEDNRL